MASLAEKQFAEAAAEERLVVVDGAMGTELLARGAAIDACLEELCASRPELPAAVHAAYVDAGANVVRANTCGANRARLAKHGIEARVRELNARAVEIAKACARGRALV